MNDKVDLKFNVPTLLTILVLIVGVGIDIGVNRQTLSDHQRQIDDIKADERHDRELIEKFGQVAMATQAVNATLSDFIKHMPPPPRGHPNMAQDPQN